MNSRRVRIAFVSSHAQLGGSERYLETLVGNLDDSFDPVVVYLQRGPAADAMRARSIDIRFVEVGSSPSALVSGARKLNRILRSEEVGVVHANGVKAALLCSMTPRPVPFVWVKHDFSWDGPLTRFIAARARSVVGVSRVVLGDLPEEKTRVVPPGLSIAADADNGARALQRVTGSEGPYVTLVGLLNPVKGQRELIRAAPEVLRQIPTARLVLVGGDDPSAPNERALLEEEASAVNVSVAFTGYRSDALDLLAASDVIVVPTVATRRGGREGFGLVAVEALTLGTPVVGYRHGALIETVGDCGILVTPGSIAELSHGIVTMLESAETRARAVRCGRQRTADRYAIATFVDAMQRCYEEVLTRA